MAATLNGNTPKITFYTSHVCPFAHRADITLQELGLPYEEVLIDLAVPRPQWYLDINPRGLVPSIKYSNSSLKEQVLYESAIVSQFLAESVPNHLLPPTDNKPETALLRARMAFITDTWTSKASSFAISVGRLDTLAEKEEACKAWAAAIEKEIEPLLKDAKPFFGGSDKLTFVETQIAPFLMRLYAFSNDEIYPKSLTKQLDSLPNFSQWAKAIRAHPSTNHAFDEADLVKGMTARIEKMKASK